MTVYDANGVAIQPLPANAAQESGGNLAHLATNAPTQVELLQLILKELQITNRLLAMGFNLDEADVQSLRDDPNFP